MNRRSAVIAIGLFLLTFLTFLPVLHCGFIDFDDPSYVTSNPHVLTGLNAADFHWAWTTTHAGYWQPLSWLSLMLDASLGGANPHIFHFTNLLLHALSAGVVFLVLSQLTGATWRAALVAALYAVHPLRVESVAWVAERKDVLSNLFAWLTIGGYIAYTRLPNPKRYLLVLIPFILGLLSKPMIATLPCLLLLLDYWPLQRIAFLSPLPVLRGRARVGVESPSNDGTSCNSSGTPTPTLPLSTGRGGRLGQLILEKMPLFLLAFIAGVAAMISQRNVGATFTLAMYPLSQRILNIVISYGLYIWKTIYFAGLSVFYPLNSSSPHIFEAFGAAIVLAAITCLSLAQFRHRPWLLIGWLWFLIALFPVSGIFQSGPQAMADRFSYLPCVGLLIMIVWSIPKPPRIEFVAPIIALLCFATWNQCRNWQDEQTLFAHALAVDDNNWFAHDQMSLCLYRKGDMRGAAAECEKALQLNPSGPVGNLNMALSLARIGDDEHAIQRFRAAISLQPRQYEAHVGLALLLQRHGDLTGAFDQFHQAIDLQPDNFLAHDRLGELLAQVNLLDQSIVEFHRALALNPFDPRTALDLSLANKKRLTAVADTR
jgi:Tfp pilus assembly protein PilF